MTFISACCNVDQHMSVGSFDAKKMMVPSSILPGLMQSIPCSSWGLGTLSPTSCRKVTSTKSMCWGAGELVGRKARWIELGPMGVVAPVRQVSGVSDSLENSPATPASRGPSPLACVSKSESSYLSRLQTSISDSRTVQDFPNAMTQPPATLC